MSPPNFEPRVEPLTVLLIGSGAIGSLYGGLVALGGHRLWVLAHGDREKEIAKQGIKLHDLDSGRAEIASVERAEAADSRLYDLVIVAVQAGQLASTFPALRALRGAPHIVFFGNNPDGRAAIPDDLPGSIELGFPGVGSSIEDGVVKYARVTQQPTMLEAPPSPVSNVLQAALELRGFPVKRTASMDGWLAYHAVFISCIMMALQKTGGDPARLGHDPRQLRLMCKAIREGFQALKAQHVRGLPRNLAILHSLLLLPVAVRYWGSVMRSPKGELFFAAHLRRAPLEAEALANWVAEHVVPGRKHTSHIERLVRPAE